MKKLISPLLVLCLLCPSASRAAGSDEEKLTYRQYVLPNGLTVLLHEDHYAPVVAVNIWYKVGSKNEEKGKTGFAHLFEHYMFEGSAHSPKGEYDRHTEGVGGYNNANTAQDRTDYFDVVPSEHLEETLRLESDRMGFLEPSINKESLDKQRGIVENEKRQDENQPYGKVWETMYDAAWDEGHPYKSDVIGSMEDLERASVEDVKRFHATYYTPNNAVLAIAGDIDPAKTLEMVKKWFGPLSSGARPPSPNIPPAGPLHEQREKELQDPKAQLPLVLIAYHVPGLGKPDWQEMNVFAAVLGGGRTSRLVQALQYDQQIVVSVGAGLMGLQEDDLFLVSAMPRPGVPLKQVEAAVQAEIAVLLEKGVTEDELRRVKAGLRTGKLDGLQTADGIAASLAECTAQFNDPNCSDVQMRQLLEMGAQAPQTAALKYLGAAKPVIVRVVPKTGAQQ